MKSKEKVSINVRIRPDVVERVDEVAALMGMRRATYLQYVIESWHSEDFNPITTAQTMLDKAAEYKDLDS